jgi:hypothetical protein
VLGIDDWEAMARHGAIICDIERRRILKLLPDRKLPRWCHRSWPTAV